MSTVRAKAARPSHGLDDDTTRLAVRSVGTRPSWTSAQIFAWWTHASAGSSRQVHQVDRSNTSHQSGSHHGRQLLQGHHLSFRYHTASLQTTAAILLPKNFKTSAISSAINSTSHR